MQNEQHTCNKTNKIKHEHKHKTQKKKHPKVKHI